VLSLGSADLLTAVSRPAD